MFISNFPASQSLHQFSRSIPSIAINPSSRTNHRQQAQEYRGKKQPANTHWEHLDGLGLYWPWPPLAAELPAEPASPLPPSTPTTLRQSELLAETGL
jgi:hypothetical protein